MKYKYIDHYHKRGTFGFYFKNNMNKNILSLVFQFSFKNPWFIPKINKKYWEELDEKENKERKASGFLAGWLFIYFGILKLKNEERN